jgi:hypothetical protein
MRIHSRQLIPLNEGLGFSSQLAMTGLHDVRQSMQGLLSSHGEDIAQSKQNVRGVVDHVQVTFTLSATQFGLQNSVVGHDFIVKRLACSYGRHGNIVVLHNGKGGALAMTIQGMGSLTYPQLNNPYQVAVEPGQTLVLGAPGGPFNWFVLTEWLPKQGPLPA